ncbi:MAG: tyrosine--tRNA ligase [bacterium]|nr:tyrosine--tRNA ligase [bacterium]
MEDSNSQNKMNEIFGRRVENVYPSREEATKRLKEEKRLKFYYGIDPTGPSLHIGHTVQLFLLKQLAELGHEVVLLIGDFTARIGDPTDKEATRKKLSEKEVRENMKNYVGQIKKILPGKYFKVRYNSKWLKKMSFENIVELASHVTVQQIEARDMFQERIKNEKPIYLHEFLYPLMQGYDSVAMEVDGEVGGNDQVFNMLVGRDLEKAYLGKDKIVLATRLLVDADSGKKLSKTEKSFIALNDTPSDMYGKVMAGVPDEMIATVFELATEKDIYWIKERKNTVENGENPMNFKKELASELVKIYHGEKEAQKAQAEFKKVFSQKELPDDMQEFKPEAGRNSLKEVLTSSNTVESGSEARRLLEQKGIKINDVTADDLNYQVKAGDIIKVGPRRFLKITN